MTALKQALSGLSDNDLKANIKMFGRETTKQGAALIWPTPRPAPVRCGSELRRRVSIQGTSITTRDVPVVDSVAWMPCVGGTSANTDVRTRLIRRR